MTSIDATFEEIQDEINLIKKDLVEDIFSGLIHATPIDYGVARKGWDVAKSEEAIETIEANYFMDKRPSEDRVFYPEMYEPYIKPIPKDIEKEEEIVIGNKVRYMNTLNSGYSSQAEPFFIESVVELVVDNKNDE